MAMPDQQRRISAQRLGGRALGQIRDQLLDELFHPGVTFEQIEARAQELIAAAGFKPNFSTVPGYEWATCLMRNSALCHGIPQGQVLQAGDLATLDIGLISDGFHLDTTTTVGVGQISKANRRFLELGRQILNQSIAQAKPGATVYAISHLMEQQLHRYGYGAVYALTGHGIGRELHESPGVPCVSNDADRTHPLSTGQALAIEIMYTQGSPDLELAADGWTYQTRDGSLAAMFEETVLVGNPPEVVTAKN